MLSEHVSSSRARRPVPINFFEMPPRELFEQNAERYNPVDQIWDRNLKGALHATMTALETMMGHYYEHLKVPQSKRAGIVFVYHTPTVDSYVSDDLRKRHFIIWIKRAFDEKGVEQAPEKHMLLAVEDTSEYSDDKVCWETEHERLHEILPLESPTHRVLINCPSATAFLYVYRDSEGNPKHDIWNELPSLDLLWSIRENLREFMKTMLQACIEAMYELTPWWQDLGYRDPGPINTIAEADGDDEGEEEEEVPQVAAAAGASVEHQLLEGNVDTTGFEQWKSRLALIGIELPEGR